MSLITTNYFRWRAGILLAVLLFAGLLNSPILAAPMQQDEAPSGEVTGQVFQGSVDSPLPSDLTVTLHILDALLNEQTFDTTIATSGQFVFNDVPMNPVNTYFVSTNFADYAYASLPAQITIGRQSLELSLVVYETSVDPSDVNIVGISTQIEVIESMPGMLQMTQMMRFRNTSDKLYIGEQTLADGRQAVLDVSLPIGAVVVELESADRLLIDEDNFLLIDTRPVLPGNEHFIYVVYLLPYTDGAIIDFPADYALDGPIQILVGVEDMSLTSEQFEFLGTESLNDGTFETYGKSMSLEPGEFVRYELTGGVGISAAPDEVSATNSNSAAVFFVGMLALLAVAVVGLLVLGRGSDSIDLEQAKIDALLRQLDSLERGHDAGEINHDIYQRRRVELREQLDILMVNQPGELMESQE
jgi:hypothetical protein